MTDHKPGCTGKKVFWRYWQAAAAAKRRNRHDGDAHVEPYHCRHCQAFHVGERRGYGKLDARRQAEVSE